jgi:hypothetical protein
VQHRSIIKYKTESARDFQELQAHVTAKLKAVLEKRTQLDQLAKVASVSKIEGLEQYEIGALVAVAQQVEDPESGVSVYMVRQDMERSGFTKVAATLALKALLDKSMLERFEDRNYNGEPFTAYRLAPRGLSWLFDNKSKLTLNVYETQERDDGVPF